MATDGRWPSLQNGRPAEFRSSLSGGKLFPLWQGDRKFLKWIIALRGIEFSPNQLFPLWQKSSFSADVPLPRNAKNWKFSKNRQKFPPESLTSENAKIATSLVIWWVWGTRKIFKTLNAEGKPRFSHSPKPDCLMR